LDWRSFVNKVSLEDAIKTSFLKPMSTMRESFQKEMEISAAKRASIR